VQGKSIKLKVATIRVMGRSAQGVRILNIDAPDLVVGVDRIARGEEQEAENDALVAGSAAVAPVAPAEEPTLIGGAE
jgi:DNA gyrase subunit A